ncbi:hypothetical protein [Mycobacterium vicinigordonae]|uniref:Uncharacterized protein n=1 Tax=Mycobacterium vicinigordonae TaxID=1719132 RepID=A0A7D6I7S6_9MYCO|nr:hypothetical protein [Mycobacterium vicinigordonae]QLL09078.1 hypothetical protein H0P51_09430 [Mycobacterium vicinigordonae]
MPSHAATVHVRAAITSALAGPPRVVMVEVPNDGWYVQTVFAGLRRNVPVYVHDAETTSSAASAEPGSPPPFGRYQGLVHPGYPFIAVLVTNGIGTVQSTCLDENLFAYYADIDTSDEVAERVQQLIGRLAFLEPDAAVDENRLAPGAGVVIPVVVGRPPIVYRLNPGPASENDGPHAVIRHRTFVVPRADGEAVRALRQLGFAPWRPPN